SSSLRNGTNRIEKILPGTGARFHMDDHIRRNDLCDAALDAVTGGVGFFEAGGARHVDIHVNEVMLAGAAQADAIYAEHTLDLFRRVDNLFLQARRSDIEKRVESATAEAPSHGNDHSGYHKRGE